MLCPDCGAEAQDLVQGSCARCFVKRHDIAELPPHIDVLLCATCNSRRKGETWIDAQERGRQAMLDDAVVESVRVHRELQGPHIEIDSEPQDDKNHAYDVMVDGILGGLPVDTLMATTARIKLGACTTCSRVAGGYYSAILQVRATGREPTDDERQEAGGLVLRTVDDLRERGNLNSFVTKQGKVRGGHDFYISEIDVGRIVAKKVADRFDGDVTESASLVGRKAGKDVHRVTFLVRIPPYRSGDFLDWGKGPHRLERVEPKTLVTRQLMGGRQVTIPRDRINPTHVVAKREDAKDMMVCSVVRDEALVLDPVTNKTHELVLHPEAEAQYDLSIRSFKVLVHDDQAYFVSFPPQGLKVL